MYRRGIVHIMTARPQIPAPPVRFVGTHWLKRPYRQLALLISLVVLPILATFIAVCFLQIDPLGLVWGFHGGYPEWSPDGKRIVFRCDQEDVNDGSVCVRGADRDERRVIRPWGGFYSGIRSVWSPDGRKILSSGFGVRLMNPDGTEEMTLDESGHSAVWSPDGGRIAYNLGGSIFVMNADGREKRRITTGNDPRWSPDGKWLLFGDGPSGDEYPIQERYCLYVVAADARDRMPRRNLGHGYDGAWSPDGQRVAFVLSGDEDSSIWVMDAAGSNRKRLTTGAIGADPRWSPLGDSLVYVRDGYDVCLLYPDGTTQFVDCGQDPTFSPDGKRIAFASEDGTGPSRIRIVDLNGYRAR